MKEAAGEANLTVIAIVLIGVVAAVVTPMIKGVISGQGDKACCQSLGGTWSQGSCEGVADNVLRACVQGQNSPDVNNATTQE